MNDMSKAVLQAKNEKCEIFIGNEGIQALMETQKGQEIKVDCEIECPMKQINYERIEITMSLIGSVLAPARIDNITGNKYRVSGRVIDRRWQEVEGF